MMHSSSLSSFSHKAVYHFLSSSFGSSISTFSSNIAHTFCLPLTLSSPFSPHDDTTSAHLPHRIFSEHHAALHHLFLDTSSLGPYTEQQDLISCSEMLRVKNKDIASLCNWKTHLHASNALLFTTLFTAMSFKR